VSPARFERTVIGLQPVDHFAQTDIVPLPSLTRPTLSST
jgi:hypothetical protein